MNGQHISGESQFDRLRCLVSDKCNGVSSAEGQQELMALLAASAEARHEYWKATIFHSDLEWELAGKELCDDLLTDFVLKGVFSPASTPESGRKYLATVAIAASFLLVGLLGSLLYLASRGGHFESQDSDLALDVAAQNSPLLGSIVPLASDSTWTSGQKGNSKPESVRRGDTVFIDQGAVELRFINDTISQLEAPAVLQVLSIDRVRVLQGRIKVDVPTGCEGFTVETSTAEVIDLGTSFSVEVAGEETSLVVFKGEVDLKVAEKITEEGNTYDAPAKRFIAGEAVRVTKDGTLSRIVNVLPSAFAKTSLHPSRQPVIASVKDNIFRDGLWNYYEIVWSGLHEDVLAFVDRSHEWNGITKEGLPRYLVGGDYVKTFNNDKVINDLVIDVTLNCPANLYVLLDRRVVAPQWLLERFELTEDLVGVDEGWYDEPKNFAQLGPGNGIEQSHSIWKLVVKDGGVVRLGANGRLSADKLQGTLSEANMYGIVAVPLTE